MPWILVPTLVLLTVASAMAAPLRVTHKEGVVFVDRDGVHTLAGRSEVWLPDATLIHLDVDTDLRVDTQGVLAVRNGRAFVRTTPDAAWLTIGLPGARLTLSPGGDYSILVDAVRDRVLVNVGAGTAELRAPSGALRIETREAALLLGRSAAPMATSYMAQAGDAFVVWSATRLVRAGRAALDLERTPRRLDDADARCGSTYDDACWASTTPTYGYPSYGSDWPAPKSRRHGYRPDYAPDYEPHFTPHSAPSSGSGLPSHLGPLPMFPNRLPSPSAPPPPPGRVERGRHRGPQPSYPPELPPRLPPPTDAPSPSATGRSAGAVVSRPGTTRPSSQPPTSSRKPD